jgi:hypothetical protein
MIRKQVYLTEEQNERLRRAATRQRRSEAEILREALDQHLGEPVSEGRAADSDSLFDLVGVASTESGDLSERVDELLYGSDT